MRESEAGILRYPSYDDRRRDTSREGGIDVVDLVSIVPYLTWGLLGIGIVLLVYLLSKFIPYARSALRREPGAIVGLLGEERQEREREGLFWYLAQVVRVFLFATVIYVGFVILDYLFTSPPNASIFDLVLGAWTIPVVVLVLAYWALKTIPYFTRRIKGEA